MSSARRYLLSRPRTKMYDYNYTMGERMYRPTLDSLDQRGSRSASSAAAREAAEATAAAIFSPPPPRCRSVDECSEPGDEMSAKISRLRASRAKMEEETRAMEENSQSRRAAARARLDISDRLMDSVGIKSNGSDEISFSRRPRRAISEIEDDPFFKKRTFASDSDDTVQRWSKVESKMNGSSENGFSSTGAMNRAKQSRARLAEIDSEMDELAERSKARSARRAAAGLVLSEAADLSNNSSSSQTVRVKRTTITEKRSVM